MAGGPDPLQVFYFMKPLEKNIRKNGYDYEQVKSTDYGYIYAQKIADKVIAYEVFKYKENTQFDCVSFPGNEAFGLWAWTYWDLNDALAKLDSFVKEEV